MHTLYMRCIYAYICGIYAWFENMVCIFRIYAWHAVWYVSVKNVYSIIYIWYVPDLCQYKVWWVEVVSIIPWQAHRLAVLVSQLVAGVAGV